MYCLSVIPSQNILITRLKGFCLLSRFFERFLGIGHLNINAAKIWFASQEALFVKAFYGVFFPYGIIPHAAELRASILFAVCDPNTVSSCKFPFAKQAEIVRGEEQLSGT
jgi:hypothetical protein